MLRIINLIRNENMKLVHKISSWVMIGLLILFILVTGLFIKFSGSSEANTNANWKAELTAQNKELKENLDKSQMVKAVNDDIEKQIKMNEYSIEHDIEPSGNSKTMWGFVASESEAISFISIFAIIIGAGIVSSEFSEGTIKLLLIRPSKRWEVLMAKYTTVLLASLFMLIILFVFSFILGGILFGFKDILVPHLSFLDGKVIETNMVFYIISVYGYACVNLIMIVSFAFMISTLMRNSSIAIGLSIFLMFTGNTLVVVLSKYNWVKYILFANTNLRQYADGTPIVSGMTMTFSIIVLLVYFAIFNTISWLSFTKRDVSI